MIHVSYYTADFVDRALAARAQRLLLTAQDRARISRAIEGATTLHHPACFVRFSDFASLARMESHEKLRERGLLRVHSIALLRARRVDISGVNHRLTHCEPRVLSTGGRHD